MENSKTNMTTIGAYDLDLSSIVPIPIKASPEHFTRSNAERCILIRVEELAQIQDILKTTRILGWDTSTKYIYYLDSAWHVAALCAEPPFFTDIVDRHGGQLVCCNDELGFKYILIGD